MRRGSAGAGLGKIVTIQYLRAAAALCVMAFHYLASARKAAGGADGPSFIDLGQFGVDLFFVVSGFVMWATIADAASSAGARPAGFLLRRIVRVAPLYWTATLAAALVATESGVQFGFESTLGDLLKSLFFIPAANAKNPDLIAPILVVGWTLNLEMFFYLVFAACLALAPSRRVWAIGAALGGLTLAGIMLGAAGMKAPPIVAAYTDSIVIEFFFGVALGAFWSASRRTGRQFLSRGWGAVSAAFGLAFAAAITLASGGLPDWRGLTWGPAALLIVAGALAYEEHARRQPQRLAVLVGDASYSLYLSHGMWLALVSALAPKAPTAPAALVTSLHFASGIAVAIAIHLAFERPTARALAGLLKRRSPTDGVPSHIKARV